MSWRKVARLKGYNFEGLERLGCFVFHVPAQPMPCYANETANNGGYNQRTDHVISVWRV